MERRELTLPGLHFSVCSQLCSSLSSCTTGGAVLFLTAAGARDPFSLTLKPCWVVKMLCKGQRAVASCFQMC